jgi:hypothetical protein
LNIREVIENPAWRHVLDSLNEEQKTQLYQEYERAIQGNEEEAQKLEQEQIQQIQELEA